MIGFILSATINEIALYLGAMVVGFVGLYYGAEWLIEGASQIAQKLGVSPWVVGMTIVAFGTSLPEFVVSLLSVVSDPPNPGICIGNVLGSNICNIFLIMGLTYTIKAPKLPFSSLKIDYFVMLVATFLLVGIGYYPAISQMKILPGELNRTGGIVILLIMFFYLIYLFKFGSAPEEEKEAKIQKNIFLLLAMVVAGLALLIVSARSLLYGSVGCAKIIGLSDLVIGGTIVAVGTSMPELFTSVIAAAKGKPEISIGNILGSNIFNILFILGFVGTITNIPLDTQALVEQVPLFIFSALCFGVALIKKSGVGHKTGIFFLTCYVIFALICTRVIDLSPYYTT